MCVISLSLARPTLVRVVGSRVAAMVSGKLSTSRSCRDSFSLLLSSASRCASNSIAWALKSPPTTMLNSPAPLLPPNCSHRLATMEWGIAPISFQERPCRDSSLAASTSRCLARCSSPSSLAVTASSSAFIVSRASTPMSVAHAMATPVVLSRALESTTSRSSASRPLPARLGMIYGYLLRPSKAPTLHYEYRQGLRAFLTALPWKEPGPGR